MFTPFVKFSLQELFLTLLKTSFEFHCQENLTQFVIRLRANIRQFTIPQNIISGRIICTRFFSKEITPQNNMLVNISAAVENI